MQLKSNALSKLVGRLKLATGPASRCFLVALFISVFTISYFGDPPSKTHPEYSASPGVGNDLPKPAIALAHAALANASGWDYVVAVSTPCGLLKSLIQSLAVPLCAPYRCLEPLSGGAAFTLECVRDP